MSLALHAALVFGVWSFSRRPVPIPPRQPDVTWLDLREAPPSEALQSFTELPADRADAPPEKADLLSNVTSRARDRVPGGDDALPRMQGEGDFPAVNRESGGSPSAPGAAAPSAPPSLEPGTARTQSSRSPDSGSEAVPRGSAKQPVRLEDLVTGEPDHEPAPGAAGDAGIPQPEMSNPGGNASLTGDISLNTTEWNYAPWLERFGRQLMHRWIAPPAYSMGILKEGGWAVVEVEISKTGTLLRLELRDQQGHPSLISAAQSAVRAMAPIEPLPADFPEPTLILRIRMIYPKIRPR